MKKKDFINIFSESFENNIISKLIISNKNKINTENIEFKSVQIKIFQSKTGKLLSFVYKYPQKDITKNYPFEEAIDLIDSWLGVSFLQADLFCKESSYHLQYTPAGKSKFQKKENQALREVETSHNRPKNRILPEKNVEFLKLLGVFSEEGFLRKDKTDKFIQINKYLEFFRQAVQESGLKGKVKVADMGSGKGYLTFAMYHFLSNQSDISPEVAGVEYRQEMADLCNHLAEKAGFEKLCIVQGSIEQFDATGTDILVALHACDTATDDAIYKGIKAKSSVIMVAPCCHKQIRKQFNAEHPASLFSKYGIIEERTAESVTDLIRCLILEAFGYQVKAFEFISSEHTPKNLMITAVFKGEKPDLKKKKMEEIGKLKNMFGIKEHYLEKVF
jgi:hypothetical protein